MSGLSPLAKALLESAKRDAPGAAVKAKVWSGVATTVALGGAATGVVAGGAGAASTAGAGIGAGVGGSVAAGGAFASAKMLIVGALLGSGVTLGLAGAAFYVRAEPARINAPAVAIAPAALQAANAVNGANAANVKTSAPLTPPAAAPAIAKTDAPVTASTGVVPAVVTAAVPLSPPAPKPSAPRVTTPAAAPTEDALMREASLVAEARSALRRGEPSAALTAIRAARALPSHQLVPEEMALEAQALRAQGKASEANGVGDALRGKYPDHALAR